MPVKFNVTPRKDPRDQNSQPKFYATHSIAKSINKMSTVSSVDTAAVLEAFLNVVPDELVEGRIVELGDFRTFRVSVSSEGAEQPADVTARYITNVRVLFPPSNRFKKLLNGADFEKAKFGAICAQNGLTKYGKNVSARNFGAWSKWCELSEICGSVGIGLVLGKIQLVRNLLFLLNMRFSCMLE